MGALIQKLFGSAEPTPLVAVDSVACSSECCDEVEVVSSSSDEPRTHESGHAATESYNTIPPDIENVCSSGTYAAERKVLVTYGEMQSTRL